MASKQRSNNKGRTGRRSGNPFPPQFSQYPKFKQTFEFTNVGTSASTTYSIPTQNLFGLAYFAATTTAAYALFDSYRLVGVEVWAAPEQATEATSWRNVKVEYLSESAPGVVFAATGNVMKPAHLHTQPPPGSLASFWHNQTDDTVALLTLTLGPNDIVRIHLQYTVSNGGGLALTASGVTPGSLYMNYLDATSGSPMLRSTASLQSNAYP